MKIDLCIPAFNEEAIIAEVTRELSRVLSNIPETNFVITVANNKSTDHTALRARETPGVCVLEVPIRGKGAAVIAAARASTAEVFGFIDADLSADPRDISTLLAPLRSGEYDIAIGSRLVDTSVVKRESLRTFGSRMFNLLRKIALGISVQDTQCGLKFMNVRGKNVLALCKETGWFFDMEFLARAERANLSIIELPIRWDEHRFADRKSKLNLIRDGFATLGALLRIRRNIGIE